MSNIHSMTGFAAEKVVWGNGDISCEVRSLNSRYLEIFVKLAPALRELEEPIKDKIRQKVSRGKINCSISIVSQEAILQNLKINEGSILAYKKLFERISTLTNLKESFRIADFLQFKDIFIPEETTEPDPAFRDALLNLLNATLDRLNVNRAVEGNNLLLDIQERLETIQVLGQEIAALGKENSRVEFKKLYQRLLGLIDEQKIDRNRLEMELAIISDRVDISEEVVRLKSHVELFEENLKQGSPIGKKLNFILQEMHREANTISSKNTLIEISHKIVAIKEDIERIREQVQNIE